MKVSTITWNSRIDIFHFNHLQKGLKEIHDYDPEMISQDIKKHFVKNIAICAQNFNVMACESFDVVKKFNAAKSMQDDYEMEIV